MDIPENRPQQAVTTETLSTWFGLKKQLANIKEQEKKLRVLIASAFFPTPKEGTNNHELEDHYQLKLTHGYTRDIDKSVLLALGQQFQDAGINADDLVEWKPALKLANYRKLTDEQRIIFDQCLIIKPSSPQLDIQLPAKYKKKD